MALDGAPSDSRLVFKRAMDVAGAAVLLVTLSPVFLVAAVMVKLTSPGPVFFAQERYGYMKRRFRMLKFRTMVADAEALQMDLEVKNEASGPVFKIRDDPRITPVGRFLRRWSVDELPQLWHVLTGEMSLVGPRPMSLRDVSRFEDPWLMRRFSMRPGLTCLWQIGGRSNLSFDRWIALDLEYIDRWSLGLDLKLLILTVPAVLSARGAK
jgi:lipopolysaccharide/colanic/teichoic acid biosynthesis glycosyltransferase